MDPHGKEAAAAIAGIQDLSGVSDIPETHRLTDPHGGGSVVFWKDASTRRRYESGRVIGREGSALLVQVAAREVQRVPLWHLVAVPKFFLEVPK